MTRSSTGMTLSVAIGALIAATMPAGAQERVRWQVPMSFASTLTALGDTMPWVADQLRAVSGGNIDLQVAEPGAVVPALSIFENVSTGAIDAGYSWMGYEIGQVPAAALFGATPFGLESDRLSGLDELPRRPRAAERDLRAATTSTRSPAAPSAPRRPAGSASEITKPEDFNGLKFRAAGVGGEIMTEYGMSVTMLPGGELYQALETGVLDATEFSLPTVDEQLGLLPGGEELLPARLAPAVDQPVPLRQPRRLERARGHDQGDDRDGLHGRQRRWRSPRPRRCRARCSSASRRTGCSVHVYSDDMLKGFYDTTKKVMERRSAENEMFGKVYASMMAFQEELTPWKEKGYLPRDWMSKNVYNAAQ